MNKDSRYSFRVNKEVKDKFKMYCKIMKISPSDMLSEIMTDFNNDVDRIIKMKSPDELREMLEGKCIQAEREMNEVLKANKK